MNNRNSYRGEFYHRKLFSHVGPAVRFDNQDDYVSVPGLNSLITSTNSWTISLCCYPESTGQDGASTVFARRIPVSSANPGFSTGIQLWFSEESGKTGLNLGLYEGTNTSQVARHELAMDRWYYLAVVHDQAANTMKLFVNNRFVNPSGNTGGISWDNSEDFHLGIYSSDPTKENDRFDGKMACFRADNKALSADVLVTRSQDPFFAFINDSCVCELFTNQLAAVKADSLFAADNGFNVDDLIAVDSSGQYNQYRDHINSSHGVWSGKSEIQLTAGLGNSTYFEFYNPGQLTSDKNEITSALKFNGSTHYLNIPNFTPEGSAGYSKVFIFRKTGLFGSKAQALDAILEGGKGDFTSIIRSNNINFYRSRSRTFNSGFFAARVDYHFDDVNMLAKYQTARELQTMKMKWYGQGQKPLIYGVDDFGEIPAGGGSDFSTDYTTNDFRIAIRGNGEHYEGYLCFYGFMRGEIKEEHINIIWNNGFPIMPKSEWGYDWEVILKFDSILNPATTPELQNFASDINPQAGNYRVYLNNYSATELDDQHADYAIRNMHLLK